MSKNSASVSDTPKTLAPAASDAKTLASSAANAKVLASAATAAASCKKRSHDSINEQQQQQQQQRAKDCGFAAYKCGDQVTCYIPEDKLHLKGSISWISPHNPDIVGVLTDCPSIYASGNGMFTAAKKCIAVSVANNQVMPIVSSTTSGSSVESPSFPSSISGGPPPPCTSTLLAPNSYYSYHHAPRYYHPYPHLQMPMPSYYDCYGASNSSQHQPTTETAKAPPPPPPPLYLHQRHALWGYPPSGYHASSGSFCQWIPDSLFSNHLRHTNNNNNMQPPPPPPPTACHYQHTTTTTTTTRMTTTTTSDQPPSFSEASPSKKTKKCNSDTHYEEEKEEDDFVIDLHVDEDEIRKMNELIEANQSFEFLDDEDKGAHQSKDYNNSQGSGESPAEDLFTFFRKSYFDTSSSPPSQTADCLSATTDKEAADGVKKEACGRTSSSSSCCSSDYGWNVVP